MVDPGWKPSFRYVGRALLLFVRVSPDRSAPRLLFLRASFLAFLVLALVVAALAPVVAAGTAGPLSPEVAAAVVAGFGLFASAATYVVESRRPLIGVSSETLGAKYQEQFFTRVAFAHTSVMAGFVFAYYSQTSWVMAIGLAFGLALLARAAPTVRRIANDDFELSRQGGTGSLLEALLLVPEAE